MKEKEELILLVNKKGGMNSFTEKLCEYIIKEHGSEVDCRIVELERRDFKNGEFKPHIKESIRRKKVFYITDSTLEPSKFVMDVALVSYSMKYSSASESNIIIPYLPWLRQDVKDESGVPISAKVVADIISLYSDRCVLCDPHFKQVQGYFRIPTDILNPYPLVVKYLKDKHPELLPKVQLLTADGGSGKRVGDFAQRAGLPLNLLTGENIQKRDPQNPGVVLNKTRVHGELIKEEAITIEDMIDGGGTLLSLADGARERELKKIIAYATHCINTNNAIEKLKQKYDLILVTDTIPCSIPQDERFEIIPLDSLFGEVIYRIGVGQSVNSLFK